MSEAVVLSTGETEDIHGTFVAAKAYVAMQFGETYDAWTALAAVGPITADDRKKKTLATAVRFLNAQVWQADYDTFAKRDLVAAFATAEYELAVMIAADPSVIAAADQGSNIQSVSAGGASVSYFNSTTKGAPVLPPSLMRLVGQYLAASSSSGPVSPSGQSGSCVNPFSSCEDLDRGKPY